MSTHAESAAEPDKEKPVGRQRSTIEFPYSDLDDAEEVASSVHQVGGTSCSWDQLAAKMKQAPLGGGFRSRVSAARSFGLLTWERNQVALTDLGISIIDPPRQRAARAEAFMNVALFSAAFEKFRNAPLPPALAIERQFEQMGVAPKQKDKARQVFMRSAKSAGYFELAADRLVAPVVQNRENDGNRTEDEDDQRKNGRNGDKPDTPEIHPFIRGLLDKLPEPDSSWPTQARAKWLQTAANIFDLMYSGGGPDINVAVSSVPDAGSSGGSQ